MDRFTTGAPSRHARFLHKQTYLDEGSVEFHPSDERNAPVRGVIVGGCREHRELRLSCGGGTRDRWSMSRDRYGPTCAKPGIPPRGGKSTQRGRVTADGDAPGRRGPCSGRQMKTRGRLWRWRKYGCRARRSKVDSTPLWSSAVPELGFAAMSAN